MSFFFSNLPGLFALTGIPILLAIHFLQNRSKERRLSTLFLLEAIAPESRTGRIWEKLRSSRNLWLQILSVLLVAWVLAQPRWLHENETRTTVFVLDDSSKMQAFRKETIAAVEKDISRIASLGIPCRWIIMSSSTSKRNLYNGTSRNEAINAMGEWTPDSGEHDPEQSLKTASLLAGEAGITRFITSSSKRAPVWQSSVGVGSPLDNVGIVGITPDEQSPLPRWRIALKNNSPTPQSRVLSIQTGNLPPVNRTLSLAPGSVAEFETSLPEGIDSAIISLNPDAFTRDDVLPLVRPNPKPIKIHVVLPDKQRDLFQKIASSIPGIRFDDNNESGKIPVLTVRQSDVPDNADLSPTIILPREGKEIKANNAILSEKHELTKDLSWGGLIVSSIGSFAPGDKADILLWSGDKPLAWIENRSLILNWNWEKSNADRLPTTALMIRRFIDRIRQQEDSPFSVNLPTSSILASSGGKTLEWEPPFGKKQNDETGKIYPFAGQAPANPGFFTVKNEKGDNIIIGAAFSGDAREGDFSLCDSFDQNLPDRRQMAEKISSPDELTSLWLALAGAALIWSWLPCRQERNNFS